MMFDDDSLNIHDFLVV